ncbi:MAG: flagellar basal body-associated FliL family protein [Planctomycetaceae bacterium]
MADSEATEPQPQKPAGGKRNAILWGLIGLFAASAGFAVPQYLPDVLGDLTASTKPAPDGVPPLPIDDGNTELAFIRFGEVVVNLDEGRLNRYLRLNITLAVDKRQEPEITSLIESRKVILKNWLITYLSDKDMDDIRGAAGQNRLRREINEYFNSVLFQDGFDRIRNVLFEDFNVQ